VSKSDERGRTHSAIANESVTYSSPALSVGTVTLSLPLARARAPRISANVSFSSVYGMPRMLV
jgi:hypothetical protein